MDNLPIMTYHQIDAYFGGCSAAAKSIGIKNKQTVHAWKSKARIPTLWQLEIERLTSGRLKADAASRREARKMAAYVNGHDSK